ncbi:MAG TPA: flagellar biosynthetic protein FliO [Oxalicibacterium sp.]|uniref:flagellar biosynthetic protein FliO n=1 Tax=Oxalicibacterium sp. TaxID=2766525 RepID=UPI002BF23E6A|nr:flagellar biosynthetic protein FliO [Oxalicibacterium sp.]HWU99165.1 flagellar biosynthetic protein FliO [Oxalicibacterium sp.]
MLNRPLRNLLLLAPAMLTSVVAVARPIPSTVASMPAPSPTGGLLQVLLGLIVVLGLMAALAWVLRRFNSAKGLGHADIRVIGGVSVGNRERVVVVEIADQWIVVGVAPGRVSAVATMQKQDVAIATDSDVAPPAKNFSNWLAQTLEKRNGQ